MTYTLKEYKFHKLCICNETTNARIGPFSRFEKPQLQQIVDILNKQFNISSKIEDKQINNLAYYCGMVYEMFLTVNWEYEKIGKGTPHHEVIRAGTEELAKEYYFKGFKELLKEMGYDKNLGEEYIE